MKKRTEYIQLATALLIVGLISLGLGSSSFVGADAATNTLINAVGVVTVFGGVAIVTSLILFALAAATVKTEE